MQKLQESSPDLLPIFNITQAGFLELMKSSLNLDQLFYLECVKNNVDLRDLVPKDRLLTWKQSLVRKGFLTEDGIPTEDGNLLLTAVGSGLPFRNEVEKKREAREEDFDRWWKTYPSSDHFEHKGKEFKGSRALRIYKEKCRIAFHQIINEGEVTADDLIRSLEYEIWSKKEESVRIKENKMSYMRNTHSYLSSRMYEGFLEVSKKKPIVESKKVNSEDI